MEENSLKAPWWGLTGISLLAFTAFLDFTIVNTALPFIKEDFNISIIQLQWIANIFTIILSMSMIPIGKLADFWGRKKVFFSGVVLFGIAALGAGLSPNALFLIGFRGLQSLGASTLFIVSAALISNLFPQEHRVKAISIYSGVTGLGLVLGPFFGGLLVALAGWRWVFFINIPIILIGFIICLPPLKQVSDEHHNVRLDKIGLLLLALGLGCSIYGILELAQASQFSLLSSSILAIGIVAIILLVSFDLKKKNPLLSLFIFKNDLIKLVSLSAAGAGVCSTVIMFFDPLYLKILRNLSPLHIGFVIAVIPLAQVILSFNFVKLKKWIGLPNLLLISIIAAFCAVLLHRFFQAKTPYLLLMIPLFLTGVSWGIGNSGLIAGINHAISDQNIGEAIGTIATIWNIIGAVMLAASAAIFHVLDKNNTFLTAFHQVFNLNIVFTIFLLVMGCFMRMKLSQKKS